jgi:hypothetical protein
MANSDNSHSKISKSALAIFCRAPRLGQVKTRLAQTHGDEFALGLYRAMLADTFDLGRALAPEIETFACFSPRDGFEGDDSLAELWDGPKIAQCEGDLGARMLGCFADLRALGYEKIVLIGSDSPDLPLKRLKKSFENLQNDKLVIGRAHDGGFYLIGASEPVPSWLFQHIDWSGPQATGYLPTTTPSVQIISNLRGRGIIGKQNLSGDAAFLSHFPYWRDVDDAEDLKELKRRLFEVGTHAPHTREFLADDY